MVDSILLPIDADVAVKNNIKGECHENLYGLTQERNIQKVFAAVFQTLCLSFS